LSALQNLSLTNSATSTKATQSMSIEGQTDGGGMSPLVRLMSSLQKLQESDPTKYQEVTQAIADKLNEAASTAESNGDTKAAEQLSQLAENFSSASSSGELPDIDSLADAIGRPQGPPPPPPPPPSGSDDASSTDSTSSTDETAVELLQQLLAAFQSGATQNNALDPMSIIGGVLEEAGVEA
jgi:hypothetical protein